MQNWYNGLTKGQRIVIAVAIFIILCLMGGVVLGAIGLIPSVFFELGRRK